MNYKRYGLNGNPYHLGEFQIGYVNCFEQVHPIDEKALEASISEAMAKGIPLSYVITGISGSGRTALARYLVSVYDKLMARDVLPTNRIAHYQRDHDGNGSGRQVAREVLKGLAGKVKLLGADLKDGPVKDILEGMKGLSADYSAQDLQDMAGDFSAHVHGLGASFTCLVEDVPNVEVFRTVRSMLANSKGLLVCTLVTEQRQAVLATLKSEQIGQEIVLANLRDYRTCVLAEGRWEKCSATPPLPFDVDGLKNAFHDNARTVGRSLETLAFMIDSKLATYPGASLHPDDTGLLFDEQQIRNLIKLFDGLLK